VDKHIEVLRSLIISDGGKCLEKFFKTSCIYGRRKPKGQILIYLLFAFQFQQIQSNISKKIRFLFFH